MGLILNTSTVIRNLSIGPSSGGGGSYSIPIDTTDLVQFFDMASGGSWSGTGTTLTDLSGNSNDVTITHGSPGYVSAGASSYMDIGSNQDGSRKRAYSSLPSLADQPRNITIQAWLRPHQRYTTTFSGASIFQLFGITHPSNTDGTERGNLALNLNDTTPATANTFSYNVSQRWFSYSPRGWNGSLLSYDSQTNWWTSYTNNWTLLSITLNTGGYGKVYINNNLFVSNPRPTQQGYSTTAPFASSTFPSLTTSINFTLFDTSSDSLDFGASMVYNRELSATEIETVFDNMKSRYGY